MLSRGVPCNQLGVLLIASNIIAGTLASMKSLVFQLHIDPQGQSLCSSSQPSDILTMPSGSTFVQCAFACTVSSTCLFYQFKSDVTHCEMFSYLPENFDVMDHCTGFIAQGSK